MHIQYLDYFYKVAIAGSISKVANSEHISQSALSQQISKLEDNLGYKLLERSNKGVELTDKGMIVLKYTDNILRTYNTMMEQLKDEGEQNIKIEACWSIATYSLPCVIYIVKDKYPAYNYELNSNESDLIEENVMNNICDLGVIYSKPKNKGLLYNNIGKDRFVLVSSPNYQIADEISLDELKNYPFLLLNNKTHLINTISKRLEGMGSSIDDLKILFNSDSAESIKSSILNGHGIGFLPYTSIKKDLYNKQLKLINIKDFSIEYEMYLISSEKINDNTKLKEFIDYFKQIANKNLC
jgi:DNA-binding transcriptional LysR family regulator